MMCWGKYRIPIEKPKVSKEDIAFSTIQEAAYSIFFPFVLFCLCFVMKG